MSRPPARHGFASLVAALLLVCSAPAGAVVVKDALYGVKVLGARQAWTVGNYGAIYHSADGGRTWEAMSSGTRSPLFGVDFSDAERGWVVGRSGLILRTTDGGRSWAAQKSPIPPDKHLFAVAAVSATNGWAVGDWGAIAVTRDGGSTWEDRSLGVLTVRTEDTGGRAAHIITEDVILYDLSFPDADHGFIAGEFGTVLATADGGATWTKQNTGTEKTLFGVHFPAPERGWAVGLDGLILRTRDGGVTWEVQRGLAGAEALEDVGFVDALKNPGLYSVSVTGQYGVITGDTGTLLVSADGGETWTEQTLPEKDRLRWMRAVSLAGPHGLAVGSAGLTVPIASGRIVLTAP